MDRTIKKRLAAKARPPCPECGKDMKRTYTYDSKRKQYVAFGWGCEEHRQMKWDKDTVRDLRRKMEF